MIHRILSLGAFAVLLLAVSCQSPVAPNLGASDVSENDVGQARAFVNTAAMVGKNHPGTLAAPSTATYAPVGEANWATATWVKGANWSAAGDLQIAVFAPKATKVILELYTAGVNKETVAYDYDMKKNATDNIWRASIKAAPDKILYGFRAWGPNWPYNASWNRGGDLATATAQTAAAAGFIIDCDVAGNRFDPNKVLYDPYSRELSHDKTTNTLIVAKAPSNAAITLNDGIFGTGSDTVYSLGAVNVLRRNYDTATWAPKSVALKPDATALVAKPAIARKDLIVYEASIKGITQDPSALTLATSATAAGLTGVSNVTAAGGTYAAAAQWASYLKALGYTAVEFMPVMETNNDTNSSSSAGGNFWGYQTYGFFAPDRYFASNKALGGPTKEFKTMVNAFHTAGIKVLLDVVYNHTGEGGLWGKIDTAELTSFRGLANQEYYHVVKSGGGAEAQGLTGYQNDTGCGNNFFAQSPAGEELILDSLAYWTNALGVDGYRFDLAVTLARTGSYPANAATNTNHNNGQWYTGYDSVLTNGTVINDIGKLGGAGTFTAISGKSYTGVNAFMIAEAWDCSDGGEVGSFPSTWGDWNGYYRDTVRSFVKDVNVHNLGVNKDGFQWRFSDVVNGTYGQAVGWATGWKGYGLAGSGPDHSVNLLTTHDGFTLADLVSYNTKNNGQVWPWGASDGGNDTNLSWDSGGDSALRRQQLRNLLTIQYFSRGIPMQVYGDEFGRSQNGNNNAYNLTSVATFNNYNMISSKTPQTVIAGQHNNLGTNAGTGNNTLQFLKNLISLRKAHVALRQSDYTESYSFNNSSGGALSDTDSAMFLRISGTQKGDKDFLLCINGWSADVNFTIGKANSISAFVGGTKWVRIIDTASWAENNAASSANNNYWGELAATSLVINAANANYVYGVKARSITVFEQQ